MNSNKNAILKNAYISQCKICRDGIFSHQKFEWNRYPLGLCHLECIGDVKSKGQSAER